MPEKSGWYPYRVKLFPAAVLLFASVAIAQDNSGVPADLQSTVDRIRSQRIKGLDHPTAAIPLPPRPSEVAPIKTAEEQQADLEDSAILLRTMRTTTVDDLVTSAELRDSTEQDARDLLGAAQRMAERGDAWAQKTDEAVAKGVAPADAAKSAHEEAARRHDTLDLVTQRVAMLSEFIEMARADDNGPSGARRNAFGTLRYDGSGRLIKPSELATLQLSFQKKFSKPLPISAWGETVTHAMLGFDHRGRVDVAVGPDSAEGRWIRAWLEHAHIPYYGFRMALLGSSTGPHIHIGPGSMRIRTMSRRGTLGPTG